ncbi:DUF6479 family protein [Streptomyces aurantiogriseus]|uniref:Secreted protein n=1 Tax=Streptomyces aurantiogriseus TaxID=66870 RepID=A0A918CMC6_9ACTN|nr:DUF6479 family protein [Streptomyces aurantiogriseus]GGR32085.1 hypothetical protein GCM10010251_55190 [Streptomyces aurantiogriseus]
MDTYATAHLAASGGSALASVVLVVVGVALVLGLLWAFRLGYRVRRREPAPPRPHEQPRMPESGPVGQSHRAREPNEMPRPEDGERLTPHDLRPTGGRDSDDQSRPRWDRGSSGSFGSGGPGVR